MPTLSTHKPQKPLRMHDRGLRIAYIGDGKGKTTAAVGVAVRARGYGLRVVFVQFYKSPEWPSGERQALNKLGVDVRVYGEGFVGILGDRKKKTVHKRAAQRALRESLRILRSGRYDLIILDEAISCLEQRLYTQRQLLALLDVHRSHPKARRTHLVLTGHTAFPAVIKRCDLVTRMGMVKHPYYEGFLAVRGIDF